MVWLEPFPDTLLDDSAAPPGAISLAFVAALQALPGHQLAVLILRDVLGYPAAEVAGMLAVSVETVTSALKRARAGLQRHRHASGPERPPAGSPTERVLVERFARAYASGDVDALVALLTDDVYVSMPPMPIEYRGRAAAARFFAAVLPGRRYRLVPTRANGSPAFATYGADATGLLVVTPAGVGIGAVTRFDGYLLPRFGLS